LSGDVDDEIALAAFGNGIDDLASLGDYSS